jgi:hypothetical protein
MSFQPGGAWAGGRGCLPTGVQDLRVRKIFLRYTEVNVFAPVRTNDHQSRSSNGDVSKMEDGDLDVIEFIEIAKAIGSDPSALIKKLARDK